MQPPVVLGGPAVTQFAVATRDPSDAAFDHRPVLSVNRLEFRCFGLSAGSEQHRIMLVQGEFSAPARGSAAGPQRAVATPDAKIGSTRSGDRHGVTGPAGHSPGRLGAPES